MASTRGPVGATTSCASAGVEPRTAAVAAVANRIFFTSFLHLLASLQDEGTSGDGVGIAKKPRDSAIFLLLPCGPAAPTAHLGPRLVPSMNETSASHRTGRSSR